MQRIPRPRARWQLKSVITDAAYQPRSSTTTPQRTANSTPRTMLPSQSQVKSRFVCKSASRLQLWFHTPAFLVDLFRKVNPQVELVSSDPVMDELRMERKMSVSISAFSSAIDRAAVARSRISSSAASTSFSGASSRSSTSSGSRSGPARSGTRVRPGPPRCRLRRYIRPDTAD